MAKYIQITVTYDYTVTEEELSNDTLKQKFFQVETDDDLYAEENEDLREDLEQLAEQGDADVTFIVS